MIHLLLTKLDSVTIKEWETSRSDISIPTAQLTDFLSKRCQTLEAVSGKTIIPQSSSNKSSNAQKTKNASSHITTANQACIHCKANHFIFQCDSFRKLPVEKRFKIVKNAHLCLNCLKNKGHQAEECTAGSYKRCAKPHNNLLHFENSKGSLTKNDDLSSTVEASRSSDMTSTDTLSPVVTQCSQIHNANRVLLQPLLLTFMMFTAKSINAVHY